MASAAACARRGGSAASGFGLDSHRLRVFQISLGRGGMTLRLRDLIKQVRQCKTAAEERNVVAKEGAALRQAFKEQDGTYRHRNVAKLMYIHMLGYPTHFGQMETLKLIASNGYPDKRVGYLGLMILLDERQEVLMLVTNSLKNDLNSRNQYTVGLALCALGNICSAEMARDLGPEVERLLVSPNPYLRKKAALCASRVLRKCPEMLDSFLEKAPRLLDDRSHSVLLAGATLMLDICAQEPAAAGYYRSHVPVLCRILRSLIMAGFAPDYDVGGINDPFLQVSLLRLLRVLGHGNAEASDAMSDVLAQVATNTDSARNPGNAILYECVQTIMAVESIGGLRVLAVNILGRFLANKDNNIRYVALNTLSRVVGVDAAAVQRHRATIVECVKDADISIRRRALELVYALVSEGNIRTLAQELLDYLRLCDPEFKPDLANKVCQLVQRYAPDKRWYIDSLLQVLVQAGAYVRDDACRALLLVVVNAAQLHGYAVRAAYRALSAGLDSAQPSLLLVATWCLGEYGELLVGPGSAQLLEGETPLQVGQADVVGMLEAVLQLPNATVPVREYALTALAKLVPRLPASSERAKQLVAAYRHSSQVEVQTRSVEYSRLFAYPAIEPQVLEHIPPVEETAYDATLEPSEAAAAAGAAAASSASAAADLAALLGLDAGMAAAAPPQPAAAGKPAFGAAAPSGVDALADLLAGGDLLGGPAAAQPAPAPYSAAAAAAALAPAAAADPLADLFGPPAPVAAPAAASQGATITAFAKGPLTVTFQLAKQPGSPSHTNIVATYSNSGGAALEAFTLQAAVPKAMQLRLEPATATAVPAYSSGGVSQRLHVTNSLHGQKALVMRLRISYSLAGQQVLEQAEVTTFPPGY
ncbi:hypothetical protein D9Q98_003118 [Chlorella vulgaris]|uniref:AP-1 complex subunit gamma n=1 Tax=Chlorella vulgaris TaxID=3077 RepID=A0A9D4TSF0_CHLVU|nr:hypothetical protein D9Q98_003118 [Chlorella vulgaris]